MGSNLRGEKMLTACGYWSANGLHSSNIPKEYYKGHIGQRLKHYIEHLPHDKETMGLNPTVCWSFFLSTLTEMSP